MCAVIGVPVHVSVHFCCSSLTGKIKILPLFPSTLLFRPSFVIILFSLVSFSVFCFLFSDSDICSYLLLQSSNWKLVNVCAQVCVCDEDIFRFGQFLLNAFKLSLEFAEWDWYWVCLSLSLLVFFVGKCYFKCVCAPSSFPLCILFLLLFFLLFVSIHSHSHFILCVQFARFSPTLLCCALFRFYFIAVDTVYLCVWAPGALLSIQTDTGKQLKYTWQRAFNLMKRGELQQLVSTRFISVRFSLGHTMNDDWKQQLPFPFVQSKSDRPFQQQSYVISKENWSQ